jgi:hypothetical protein
MTKRATLEALLARVLAGTGPDRELDGDFAEALQVGGNPWKHEGDGWISVHGFGCQVAMFTQSLDAALTLVPEGWSWHAALRTYLTPFRATGSVWQEGRQYALFNADAATPARALIAACIKARMEALGE